MPYGDVVIWWQVRPTVMSKELVAFRFIAILGLKFLGIDEDFLYSSSIDLIGELFK